jgi:hypothetical protein
MTTLLISSGVILGIILITWLSYELKIKLRKDEFKDWVVGDKLILKPNSSEHSRMEKAGEDLATLVGWTENNIYIKIGKDVWKSEWSCFDSNKSVIWRRNHEECKTAMGKNPGFSPELNLTSSSGSKIDGKPIELLSEVECEVFLKLAIEEEDYDTAELIRKRMEKFR